VLPIGRQARGGAPWVEVATAATPMAAPATGLPPPQERGT